MLLLIIKVFQAGEVECPVVEVDSTTIKATKEEEAVLLKLLKCRAIQTLTTNFLLLQCLHIRIMLDFNNKCLKCKRSKVIEVAVVSVHVAVTTIAVVVVLTDHSTHQGKMVTRAQA